MQLNDGIVLKPGKESIFHQRHYWLFSGAISTYPKGYKDGALYPIFSSTNELLGHGYFNRKTALCGRIVSFGEDDPYQTLSQNLRSALDLRKAFFDEKKNNAFRLINGEGDRISGLIVDLYGPYLVLQVGTLGIEKLKGWIVDQLMALLPIKGIYEKSTSPSRKEEGLVRQEGILWGEIPDEITVREDDLSFIVSPKIGQKTGFFLDHREMRRWVGQLAKDKRVLNCFSYTGGFTIHALKGGATRVDSVDISEEALRLLQANTLLNGFSTTHNHTIQQDVFDFLREHPLDYELVILDPPAFAKKSSEVDKATVGYRDINKVAMEKMPSKSLLVTSSCSYHVDETLFQKILFQAGRAANRQVRIIGKHRLSPDHPINLFHPQADYLKSFVLYLE